jgi:predicted DCC family thiol-disulfide oxidoreductase YuxK
MKCVAVSPTRPRVRPMAVDRAILIYDGECGFCRQTVAIVSRWDREHRLTLIPFQDQARVAAFHIPLPALAAAMHLVLPDGRVLAGADAAADLLRLLPGKRWLAGLFALPGVLPVARRMYGWIARQRRCLVRGVAPE